MGQLEKYGLYVLCLVIFLILGVAIWGDPEVQRAPSGGAAVNAALVSSNGSSGSQGPVANGNRLDRLSELLDNADGPAVGPGTQSPSPGPGTQQPQPQPQPAARPQHKVVSGDSFDSIARQLGSSRLVAELQRLNPTVKPERMALGSMLVLPTKAEIDAILGKASSGNAATAGGTPVAGGASAAAVPPVAGGTRSYKVTRGDTLEGIARRELGNPRRVDEIRKLNPSVDPLSLKIGHTLTLPAK